MQGHLSLILHAHLPFVRHPEHENFLEENWLFEAITETYVPLLQMMEGWQRDGMDTRLTLTLTPTLCAMLLDPLLQGRYVRHLDTLIDLAEKELHRTHWDQPLNQLAQLYFRRLGEIRGTYFVHKKNLVAAFASFQEAGRLEIITSAATHALLPLLANHPPSLRAQVLVARDHYRSCFGRDPRGIWLPECAYVDGVETVLQEANIRWFITDTHGLLHANPRPRYGVFAPIFTPNGIAAFGRDLDSAKQVWSKHEGYPGAANYRDFYRDIGFDLDLDYLRPYLPAPDKRGFTGIKYFRITGNSPEKQVYNRGAALQTAAAHAQHFLEARIAQIERLAGIMDRPPLMLSPYDAELFGHWWYEGPEFLDYFVRKAYYDQNVFSFLTPEDYLKEFPSNQIARPGASSWGEEGYWRVWLNETNEWIYPHLQVAQERMTKLGRDFPKPNRLQERALKQAARELLLAQSSDWPFILRTGTSPDYARKRVKDHLFRFIALHDQLTSRNVDEAWLKQIEARDNLFPDVNYRYWK
ncbi:MAG TPA: 1,4-alpha-glucan branching protein domain-containing protein [Verrucomicrobiae bacterium]|jgi:1,4-alpha-glucan branching enzyme|nr:1,4-alpha-glucan branching protein domain-containing protein [Verrucomicrobiae bacterium]